MALGAAHSFHCQYIQTIHMKVYIIINEMNQLVSLQL